MKRIVVALVAVGIIGTAGLTAGCGTTTYSGGCLAPLDQAQRDTVTAYIAAHRADARTFIDKGRQINVCNAVHDPYEPGRKARPGVSAKAAEPERVDLEFDGDKSDEQALVAGYATMGLPSKPGIEGVKVVTQQVTLQIQNGTSKYKWEINGQNGNFQGKTVEIETDQKVPDKVTFTLP